jgi:acyl carrier protein
VIKQDNIQIVINRRREVLAALVLCLKENLNVPFRPDVIHPDAPLFGSGLGLDSIDALEVVMVVEKRFGVVLDESNVNHMRTLNTLADVIIESRQSAGIN